VRISSVVAISYVQIAVQTSYHDNARRAKAALAATAKCYTLLSRVWVLDVTNAFHRNDMLAINAD